MDRKRDRSEQHQRRPHVIPPNKPMLPIALRATADWQGVGPPRLEFRSGPWPIVSSNPEGASQRCPRGEPMHGSGTLHPGILESCRIVDAQPNNLSRVNVPGSARPDQMQSATCRGHGAMHRTSRMSLFAGLWSVVFFAACGGGPSTQAPAPETPRSGDGVLPEQPSSRAMEAALNPVMPRVKHCVKDAPDVSRAKIVFLPSGHVDHVEVTGWAATHGASDCIVTALKDLDVGPFSKASFSTGLTVRP